MMTVAIYGPRCNVHPDRTGTTRTPPYRLLVVHTSEGGEGPTGAENLCSFMQTPGDRTDPADGSKYGASYHYVTDTDRVLPATLDNVVAYAAAGANNDGIHICIPGKAAQTRDQWLDVVSRSYIRQLAAVMADKALEFDIPLRPLPVVEIVKGAAGYCGHVDISHAYHRSNHTDPGPSFPWDVLADDIAELLGEEDDMTPLATPERAYDSRPTEQAGVNPALAAANSAVPKTQFGADEQRAIVIGMTNRAFVHVTVIGTAPGYVEVAGAPFGKRPSTSIANVDPDGITSGGGPVATPEGKVYIWSTAPCDIAVDVRAR